VLRMAKWRSHTTVSGEEEEEEESEVERSRKGPSRLNTPMGIPMEKQDTARARWGETNPNWINSSGGGANTSG